MPSGVCQASPSGAGAAGFGLGQAMLGEIGDHAAARSSRRCARLAGARRRAAPSSGTGRRLGVERRRPAVPTSPDRASCRRSGALAVRDRPRRACRAPSTIRDWMLAGDEAVQDAAFRFDRLELLPRRFAKRIGQRLDAAGAGGRVGDEIDMAFAGQDELRVAGDAAGKGVRQAVRDRVRQDRRSNRRRRRPRRKPAIVVRRMLVSGSFAVIMR